MGDALAGLTRDVFVRYWTSLHEGVYRATGGRLLNATLGMLTVELITVGRRSGLPRTTMLTSPWQEGATLVLVASNGGDGRNPDWFHNLVANPDVEVVVVGQRRDLRARVADGDERERLWSKVSRTYPGYRLYQAKTARRLPVVVLEPRPD
jgi:deazaflavin-dependent oxidoreductase (nitroreductase family)